MLGIHHKSMKILKLLYNKFFRNYRLSGVVYVCCSSSVAGYSKVFYQLDIFSSLLSQNIYCCIFGENFRKLQVIRKYTFSNSIEKHKG